MCCGAKSSPSRMSFTRGGQPQRQAGISASASTSSVSAPPAAVTFEYTGTTGLTVVSPTTGKRYRFDAPGAQLEVDSRDQSMLLYVPNLRPVRFARSS
jgi:hypothetical protein